MKYTRPILILAQIYLILTHCLCQPQTIKLTSPESTTSGYYVNFTVGTPPQEQNIILDTSQSDIWLISSACGTANYSKFKEGKSHTLIDLNKTFHTPTDDGYWVRDVFSLPNTDLRGPFDFGLIKSQAVDNPPKFALGRVNQSLVNRTNTIVKLLSKSNPLVAITLGGDTPEISFGAISSHTRPVPPSNIKLTDTRSHFKVYQKSQDWSIPIVSIATGTTELSINNEKHNNVTGEAILLSISYPFIGIPTSHYYPLILHLLGGLDSCSYKQSSGLFRCSRKYDCGVLPDLGMVLLDADVNPVTHTLRANDYINIETGGRCSIMIHQSDNWILET